MKKNWHLLVGSLLGICLFGGLKETVLADEITVNTVVELEEGVKNASEDRTIFLGEYFPDDLVATIALVESPYHVTIDGQNAVLQSSSGKQLMTYKGGTGTTDSSLTLKNIDLEGRGNNVRALTVEGYKGKFVLDNVKVNNFQSSDDGGAFYTSGHTVLKNSTFSNNKSTASGYSGGAIASKGFAATLEVTNSRFKGNETLYAGTGNVGGEGGAFYFYQPSAAAQFIFKNNYFEENKAVETINSGSAKLADGGAVALFNVVQGTNVLFEGNTFRKNIAGDDGGAILIQTNSNISSGIQFKNNTFFQNKALGKDYSANSGGAIQIYANGSPLDGRTAAVDYVNNSFIENEAAYDGGAVGSSGYLTNRSAGRYANNLFVGNKARNANKNNIADATIAETGNLETNIGYDNGVTSNVTMADVFGSMNIDLVDNYNQLTAGTTDEKVIIPTIPIVPEKVADNQVNNLRDVVVDQRNLSRETQADIGAVEMDWLKYDSNGGTFTFDETIPIYQGKEYYEQGNQETYYQVGYNGLERTIPSSSDLKAKRSGYQFIGWSTEKSATKAEEIYAPGKSITTKKEGITLYAIWKKSEPVTVHYMTYDENKQLVEISPDEILTGELDETYHASIKQIDGYVFAGVKEGDAISGIFTDEKKEITLIYTKENKEKGVVISQYQDEKGAPIAGDEVSIGEIGSSYHTTSKDIPGYTLKEVQGAETGNYLKEVTKVIYVYTKIPLPSGRVTVHYQSEDHTSLSEDDILTGEVDAYYSVNFKTFEGYTLKEIKGKTGGKFTNEDQEVTFIYSKKVTEKGILLAQYQDENGQPLALDEVTMKDVGTPYTTMAKEISGYSLKEVKGAETGTYSEGITTVVYIYTKDPLPQGKVTLHYQLEDQTTLAPDSELTGDTGSFYFADIPSFDGYTLKEIKGKASGQFSETDQEVTFIYTKVQQDIKVGFLLVDYQDEAGNKIAPSEITSENISTSYHTIAKEIPGYSFKEVTGQPDGIYNAGLTHIIYIYTKDPVKQGNVIVHYQTDQKEQLAEDTILTGDIEDDYVADIKPFENYVLKSVDGQIHGKFTEKNQEVTIIYTKKQPEKGFLVVDYLNENGKPLASNEFFSGKINEDYQTQPKVISGYVLKQVIGNESGKYNDEISRVSYIYEKEKKTGKIIFHYQDEAGKKIQEDQVDEQLIDTPISLSPFMKELKNYTFKEIKGLDKGIYTEQTQEITFVYTQKIGKISVRYLDTNGKELAKEQQLTAWVGTPYQLTAKEIAGYTVKEITGKETVKYEVEPMLVTYIYEKNPQTDLEKQMNEKVVTPAIPYNKNTEKKTNSKIFDQKENRIRTVPSIHSDNYSNDAFDDFSIKQPETQKTSLPKTGEKQMKRLTIIGAVLVLGILFLTILPEKEFNEKNKD